MSGRFVLKMMVVACGVLSLVVGAAICISVVINRQTANTFLRGIETEAIVTRLNIFEGTTESSLDGSSQTSAGRGVSVRYTLRDGRTWEGMASEFVRDEQYGQLSIGDRVTIVYWQDIPARFTLKQSAEFYINEVAPGTLKAGIIALALGIILVIVGIVLGKILGAK